MSSGWDETVDLLVAGSGAAGLACALVAADRDLEDILVVEKAGIVGGTTRKSAGYMWVPNNRHMHEAGLDDPRDAALRYMARLSRPLLYDPNHPTLGLPKWEYELLQAHYDEASVAIATLESLGGLDAAHAADFPDYYAHIPEDEAPKGRTLFPAAGGGGPQGGQILIDALEQACLRARVEVRVNTPVTDLVVHDGAVRGAVIGIGEATKRVRTRHGVVFATGSFAQNSELCLRYLDHPYIGAGSALTCTGDFVRLGSEVGADIANMNRALRAPMIIERMEREPADVRPSFIMSGDGLILVNRFGRRVYSEKASYHDLGRAFFDWDPIAASYPNIPLIAIWDRVQAARFGADGLGNPVPPPDVDDYWVIKGADLEQLGKAVSERLATLQTAIGRPELAADFVDRLRETLDRYARFAAAGVDDDFGRGSTASQVALGGLFGLGDGPNPTMRPLDAEGPYFATILGPGLFETSGGPRTDTAGRVLRADGSVIPGLRAAGTCAAAPWGEASWSGGMNVAYALTAGYRAGANAAVSAALRTPDTEDAVTT